MSISKASEGLPRSARGRPSISPTMRTGASARLSLAVVVGLGVGAVTEWSVLHLPFALQPLSNTAAPWVLVACALALTGRRVGESLTLAVVALVALVLGFYVAEALRGWPVSRHQLEFWSVTALVVGPLVGLAAGWLRRGDATAGAVGAGALGGLLIGEAIHGIDSLRFSTPAAYWHVQFALGVALAGGLALWRSRGLRLRCVSALAVSAGACALIAAATMAAFQVP